MKQKPIRRNLVEEEFFESLNELNTTSAGIPILPIEVDPKFNKKKKEEEDEEEE